MSTKFSDLFLNVLNKDKIDNKLENMEDLNRNTAEWDNKFEECKDLIHNSLRKTVNEYHNVDIYIDSSYKTDVEVITSSFDDELDNFPTIEDVKTINNFDNLICSLTYISKHRYRLEVEI